MDPNYYNINQQYYEENNNIDPNYYLNSDAVIYSEPEQNIVYNDPSHHYQQNNLNNYNQTNNTLQYQQYWSNNILNIPQNKYNSELITKAKEFRDNKHDEEEDLKKKETIVTRFSAGKVWKDNTLAEWPEDDYRIFVGDLGNDTTEDDLKEAFGKYPSFAKCKLIRNKRTQKSKGYAFVSFLDPNDFVKAFKEMNGKYIKNRPCKLRKGDWKKRSLTERQKKDRNLVHDLIHVKNQVKLKKKATNKK